MATAAYIAWLIVKITFFLVVLSNLGVLSMQVMDETSVIKDEVAEKIEAITEKYFLPLIKVLIVMSILCLTFLLGVWLFAPEYLP